MDTKAPAITMREVTDPVEIAESRELFAQFERNAVWFETHLAEINQHRGKHICIAGQELFVGDDSREVIARARAAHPDDKAPFFKYVPKTKAARIYAHRWVMATL